MSELNLHLKGRIRPGHKGRTTNIGPRARKQEKNDLCLSHELSLSEHSDEGHKGEGQVLSFK